ncbi:LPXTG cell wall anchor domain-containing protein [Streptomyces durbertensis]|uniref:LPXTG cell wall anchor domain-containing protein n=1 Tax=Streptomyces durbertensis TaxID=2448886 RepID=A0ABR6EA43_9ACTN|nr:SCO1860 family LAETG-anchored protein [Streptomyces durbertensis]MBB1242108.1 LPXTG cell wall anchor domain-containing protein [Streptomyces durbertensis]
MSKSVPSLLAACSLVVLAAVPAAATEKPDPGHASASVLRTTLDVGLLKKSVHVPLTTTLNAVQAPGEGTDRAEQTALTAELDGVDRGRPFTVLRADVARATADVTEEAARADVELAKARLHVPGLPLLSVVEADAVRAKAVCEAGSQPTAEANVLGSVKVLGQRTRLTAGGPTHVKVPGVGEVKLELSATETTSRTAAASALRLSISVNPLDLGVAEVDGKVTLAEVSCRTPRKAEEVTTQTVPQTPEAPEPTTEQVTAPEPQGGKEPVKPAAETPDLAATGGDSRTPYLLGGGLALFAVGGGLVLARRRRSTS